MKRDIELIRQLLIEIEGGDLHPTVEGVDADTVNYHLALMKERGLIEAIVKYSNRGDKPLDIPDLVLIKKMTWEGHDFIDSVKDNTRWTKVKDFLSTAGKDLTIETIKWGAGQLFGLG